MAILNLVLFILGIVSVVLTIIELVNLHFFFGKSREAPPLKRFPAVSIIKALKGVDAHLIENLQSFCDIDYPNYEIIFAAASPDDPVIPIIHRFMTQSVKKNMRLIVDPSTIGFNPKVNNLHNGTKVSTGEILIFSDSDTRATPDFIPRLIEPLEDERTGVSSGIAVLRGAHGFWSRAKAVTYNSTVTLYNALWCKLIPITVGGAVAIRKDVLEKIGGFQPIADRLTDDQELGKLVSRHGYRAALVPYLVAIHEEPVPFLDLMKQILRWLVAIKAASPSDYHLIVLTNTAFLGFSFWLLAPADVFHIVVFAGIAVFRVWTPFYVHRTYLGDPKAAKYSWTILPADFLFTALWLIGQRHRRVTWRGADFVLRKGKMVPLKTSGK